MAQKYEIAPQMREYDNLGFQWLPGVMFFQKPNRRFASVSTDSHGFRHTISKDGKTFVRYEDFQAMSPESPTGLVIGGSVAFGVGATHNKYTLSSLLNEQTETTWFNFGGRAFSSTQEILLLMLHRPQNTQHLLVYGGMNNLVLSHLVHKTSPVYNCIFPQERFEQGMEDNTPHGVKEALKQLSNEVLKRYFPQTPPPVLPPGPKQYSNIMQALERDILLLSDCSKAWNTRLYFALQPVPLWIDKKFTAQENQMMAFGREKMESVQEYVAKKGTEYRKDMAQICQKHDVPFLDLNGCEEFATDEWLFLDSNHLTDLGYTRSAEVIQKKWQL